MIGERGKASGSGTAVDRSDELSTTSDEACSQVLKTLAVSLAVSNQPISDAKAAATVLRGVAMGHCVSTAEDEEAEEAALSGVEESTATPARSSYSLGSMIEELIAGNVGAACEAAFAVSMDSFLPCGGVNAAAPSSVGAAGLLETVVGAALLAQVSHGCVWLGGRKEEMV